MATTLTASVATVTTPVLPTMATPDAVSRSSSHAIAIDSRRSLPTALDTTKSLPSEDASRGTDSGYASNSNTPERPPKESCKDFPKELSFPSQSLFKRRVIKLNCFDKAIPLPTKNRFNDLNELFGKDLYNYLANTKIKSSAITIKLKVLGEDEETAKPGIVVLCDKSTTKQVRRFFNQPQVKSQYQPCDANLGLPSFEIVVCDRPLRLMASATLADIYGDSWTDEATLCGKVIKIDDSKQGLIATLGGIIMVVSRGEENVTPYGMTVGHIIKQNPLDEGGVDYKEENNEIDEDDYFCSDEDEIFELNLPLEGGQSSSDLSSTEDIQQSMSISTPPNTTWLKTGGVVEVSHGNQHDLDWALVQLTDPLLYRPNLFKDLDQSPKHREPRELSRKLDRTSQSQKVVLVGGMGSMKRGSLVTSLSFLMLASGKDFIATYDLLIEGQDLEPGDCGSWVIDSITNEVYGHVVGSDVFGEAYVIPLHSTFAQIGEQLGARKVYLPTKVEVSTWLDLQAETSLKKSPLVSSRPLPHGDENYFRRVSYKESIAEKHYLAQNVSPPPRPPTSSQTSGNIIPPFLQPLERLGNTIISIKRPLEHQATPEETIAKKNRVDQPDTKPFPSKSPLEYAAAGITGTTIVEHEMGGGVETQLDFAEGAKVEIDSGYGSLDTSPLSSERSSPNNNTRIRRSRI